MEVQGRRMGALSVPDEIDHDLPGVALQIVDVDSDTVARLKLMQQRNRIMVIDKSHGLTRVERIQSAKDRRVAEAFGHTACVEWIYRFQGGVIAGRGHDGLLSMNL